MSPPQRKPPSPLQRGSRPAWPRAWACLHSTECPAGQGRAWLARPVCRPTPHGPHAFPKPSRLPGHTATSSPGETASNLPQGRTVPFVGWPDARWAALHAEHVHSGLGGAEEPAEAQERADSHGGRCSPVLGHTTRAAHGPHARTAGFLLTRLPRGQQGPASWLATHSTTYRNTPDEVRVHSKKKKHKMASLSNWTMLTLTVPLGLTLTLTVPWASCSPYLILVITSAVTFANTDGSPNLRVSIWRVLHCVTPTNLSLAMHLETWK